MNDCDWRGYQYAAWGIAFILAALAIRAGFLQGWKHLLILAGFAAATAVYLAMNHLAPAVLSALLAASVAMNAAGWSWGFFESVWGYDEIAHALGTLGVTLIVAWYGYWPIRVTLREHPWVMLLAVLTTGIALGAWWEIVEWAGFWFFTNPPLQSLNDKISDLVADSIGALFAAGFIRWGLVQKCHV